MTDNRDTMITSTTRCTLTVTASLSLADQWERRKTYAESITFRVQEIRATVDSDLPKDRPRITLSGPRILKSGAESDTVRDKPWNADDLPPAVWQQMLDVITGWRALACAAFLAEGASW